MGAISIKVVIVVISIQSYVRRGNYLLRKWALDPKMHGLFRGLGHFFAGFALSAASLGNRVMPLSLGLVCTQSGWEAVLSAVGGCAGYLLFWGSAAYQATVWLAVGLFVGMFLTDREFNRETPMLMPAVAALITASSGVLFQSMGMDTSPIAIYLLRVGLAAGSSWLFCQVRKGRNPILEWITYGVGVLSLAQIMLLPYVGLGFVAAGILTVTGAFPAAAMAGLALDLAQVTPIPMTAVLTLSYLTRLLPRKTPVLTRLMPAIVYICVMSLCGKIDLIPLPGLLLGGIAGGFLPGDRKVAYRRGETGAAQVRLEMASGVLAQTEQLLLEVPIVPVDEDALVTKAAERACGGCPCRNSCKDAKRIAQLPGLILHKPLLTVEEIPINCRKSGRFLAELHRSQEQFRSIRADRERQREYRAAVIQQYQFLSSYLQELADQLPRHTQGRSACYMPRIQVYGNRPQGDNGDRFLRFAGTAGRYYVLLCDGMGTGLGAVQEGKTAASILRRLLSAGYPAEHALRSLNSLCALRERAGAVTVDLAELHLESGEVNLYKWGAAPSYLVTKTGAEKIGTAGPPPGLSITDCQEQSYHTSLRRGQTLFMVSDGIATEEILHCCVSGSDLPPGELAMRLLSDSRCSGEDDATVVTIRLETAIDSI